MCAADENIAEYLKKGYRVVRSYVPELTAADPILIVQMRHCDGSEKVMSFHGTKVRRILRSLHSL